MFVFTAKLNRKKAVCFVAALVLLVALIILCVNLRGKRGTADAELTTPLTISSAEDAAAYLQNLGWELEPTPLEIRELVIPRSFTGAYADYAALQSRQGFPIAEYGGMNATRYSFRVLNYPGATGEIVADLVVSGQTVIAGDIQSTALDGFMVGIKGQEE